MYWKVLELAKNFIVSFTSREGSSAIISSLSRCRDINVPLFEELDAFWIKKFYNNVDIPKVLDQVFSSGKLDWEHNYGYRNYIPGKIGQGTAKSTGFKWRWHGSLKHIGPVLEKHEVMIFLLFRRDLIELTSSYYFTRMAKRSGEGKSLGHFQFKTARMTKQQKVEFKKELDKLTVPLNPFVFYAMMSWRIIQARRNKRMAVQMQKKYGIELVTIYYEDFRDDSAAMLGGMCEKLGVKYDLDETKDSVFVKLSKKPALDKIRGSGYVANNIFTRSLCKIYGHYTG